VRDLGENWTETDPKSWDSDGDGWADGPRNTRINLILTKIRSDNEQEDIGSDELYLVIDKKRFPQDSSGLDGYWDFEEGSELFPSILVGQRTTNLKLENPVPQDIQLPQDFQFTLELWEDDNFDWTDDPLKREDIPFSSADNLVPFRYDDGEGTDYTLEFTLVKTRFADPSPLDADADVDGDGLTEREEASINRGTNVAGVSLGGYFNGLADPGHGGRDLFLELDSTNEAQIPEEYSKIDVVSQFYYHDITMHLADEKSTMGGGETLDLDQEIFWDGGSPTLEELRRNHLSSARRGIFRYALAAKDVQGWFGFSNRMIKNNDGQTVQDFRRCDGEPCLVFESDFLDHVSDMESIVFIHELGHTLGLCHRPKDLCNGVENTVIPKPKCTDWDNAACRGCSHYSISDDSDTAMGSCIDRGDVAKGVAIGCVAGALLMGGVGVLAGCAVGGLVGGVYGALADLIDRDINYEGAEWAVVDTTPK
jgi:hypothetical protein